MMGVKNMYAVEGGERIKMGGECEVKREEKRGKKRMKGKGKS